MLWNLMVLEMEFKLKLIRGTWVRITNYTIVETFNMCYSFGSKQIQNPA